MKIKYLFSLILCYVLTFTVAEAKIIHLLPKPHSIEAGSGTLELSSNVTIVDSKSNTALARFVTEFCGENSFTPVTDTTRSGNIKVTYVTSIDDTDDHSLAGYESEAYKITVSERGVEILAITPTGVTRAAQTLTQMAEGWENAAGINLEYATITDWAAFKVRGYMHDVGRSYMTVDELKKHIRLLSRFKINTFHWHLTANQAWRFEVKNEKYSKLTNAEYMYSSRFPGKYYTQEESKALEAYAREYGVVVIPEIDMPGHSEAFEKALGFDMQSDEGKVALKAILDEVVIAFPLAPYIHIGADEETINDPSWLTEMVSYVRDTKGRKCIVWNPIKNIAVSSTDADMTHMTQMWGRALSKPVSGKYNIDSRYNYTNHFDVFADLVGIYKSNIYYETKGTETIAGEISATWNDRVTPTQEDIIKQNNFYASVIASGARAWTGGGERYIDNSTNGGKGHGGVMLPNSGDEYNDFKDFEDRFLFHKANSLSSEKALIPYVKQTNIRWRISDAFDNGGITSTVFPPEQWDDAANGIMPSSFEYNGQTYNTGIATGAGIYLSHTWGKSLIDAYYTNPAYNQTAYAWTYVYSPKRQTVGAQIEFQNYSRSEKDPVPTAGHWDLYGSNIWINGTAVTPPKYTNAGVTITKEVALKNENFTGRDPIWVTLNKGWNKVLLKLPYINAAYRLDKWMFTFVFTDVNGYAAVDDLVYSPNQLLDENAEEVAIAISDARQIRNKYVKDKPGYSVTSAATTLNATLEKIEKTLTRRC